MALSKRKKGQIIQSVEVKLEDNASLVFTDFTGSTMVTLQKLRRGLREKGGSYKVVKKTLLAKSLRSMGLNDEDILGLPGSIGVVFGEDPVSNAKAVSDFIKAEKTVKIVGGILENSFISDVQVVQLAKLPSREQLLAQLVGTINAPVSGFVNVLAGNLRGLVNVLNAYKDSKA